MEDRGMEQEEEGLSPWSGSGDFGGTNSRLSSRIGNIFGMYIA